MIQRLHAPTRQMGEYSKSWPSMRTAGLTCCRRSASVIDHDGKESNFTCFHSSKVGTTSTPHRRSECPPKYFVPNECIRNLRNHMDVKIPTAVQNSVGPPFERVLKWRRGERGIYDQLASGSVHLSIAGQVNVPYSRKPSCTLSA